MKYNFVVIEVLPKCMQSYFRDAKSFLKFSKRQYIFKHLYTKNSSETYCFNIRFEKLFRLSYINEACFFKIMNRFQGSAF